MIPPKNEHICDICVQAILFNYVSKNFFQENIFFIFYRKLFRSLANTQWLCKSSSCNFNSNQSPLKINLGSFFTLPLDQSQLYGHGPITSTSSVHGHKQCLILIFSCLIFFYKILVQRKNKIYSLCVANITKLYRNL